MAAAIAWEAGIELAAMVLDLHYKTDLRPE